MSIVVAAHLPQPPIDALPAGGNSWVANASVFREHVVDAYGTDMHAIAVALKHQLIARPYAEEPANFDWDRDLAFARDFGLFLHD
jgi:hypothetical protein